MRWIEGTCVLEEGTPLAGVEVVGETHWKVPTEEEREPDPDDARSSFSDSEGRFRRRVEAGQDIGVRHPHAKMVTADGGEMRSLISTGLEFWIVVTPSERVRLVFRDTPGTAHVRLVNADTGDPVTNVDGLRVAYRFSGGSVTFAMSPDPGLGGWIPIPEGRVPGVGADAEGDDRELARLQIDVAKVEVEFAMPGFEKGKVPLPEIRGRMEVRVRPVPPDATGEVRTAPNLSHVSILNVAARLRSTDPRRAAGAEEVAGLPTTTGPFALYNLPDGAWEIEITGEYHGSTVVRARRPFEKRGSPVDLGVLELRKGGEIVVAVKDSEGEAVPQAWAVVVRPEEDPAQGRRLDLNSAGEVVVADLEPDVEHRVLVKGLPRELEKAAVAKSPPVLLLKGTPRDVTEFRWPERLVPCRITLLVDGKAVANPDGRKTIPAVVQESPLPRDKGAWGADGAFEAKLVPGTYRFSALATPKEGGDMALFAGEVTVPAGDAFETRLELRRESR